MNRPSFIFTAFLCLLCPFPQPFPLVKAGSLQGQMSCFWLQGRMDGLWLLNGKV